MKSTTAVYDESYPSRRLLELIGDKWTPIIVYILGQGTKRYGEFQRHLPDVSKKMLTQTLRALERNGLLKRKVYAEVPPRVDYSLTPLGRSFLEPVTSLCAWAQAHKDQLDAAYANEKKARR
jgi:DNA-binding HxlR family transcriptional regulator